MPAELEALIQTIVDSIPLEYYSNFCRLVYLCGELRYGPSLASLDFIGQEDVGTLSKIPHDVWRKQSMNREYGRLVRQLFAIGHGLFKHLLTPSDEDFLTRSKFDVLGLSEIRFIHKAVPECLAKKQQLMSVKGEEDSLIECINLMYVYILDVWESDRTKSRKTIFANFRLFLSILNSMQSRLESPSVSSMLATGILSFITQHLLI